MPLFRSTGCFASALNIRNLILLGMLSVATTSEAQDQATPTEQPAANALAEIPPPRTNYMGRIIAPTMTYHGADWLVRAERRTEERPDMVMTQLRLKDGMQVCDMGCGNGYYTMRMARAVGKQGRVYAVDIQPEMLQMLRANIDRAKLENIEPILGDLHDPHLPKGKLDLVLMVDVYHEFSHPDFMLKAIAESLAPDGQIALLEFKEEDANVPIKPLHKMSKLQILKEYEANGFEVARQYDELPWQHLMFFRVKK